MRALIGLTFVCWSALAWAQPRPNPYLGQARVFYQELEFEKCVQRLEQAARWKNTPQELVDIEIFAGLCRYHLGQARDAEDHFLLALQLDRAAALPPYTSPKIAELFDKVKAQLPPPAAPPDAPLRAELAPPPEPPARSGADAALETDAGPRRSLVAPLAFGGAAVAAAGAGLWMGAQARALEGQANGAHFESEGFRLGEAARQRALFANVGFGLAAAAVTGAVVSLLVGGGEP